MKQLVTIIVIIVVIIFILWLLSCGGCKKDCRRPQHYDDGRSEASARSLNSSSSRGYHSEKSFPGDECNQPASGSKNVGLQGSGSGSTKYGSRASSASETSSMISSSTPRRTYSSENSQGAHEN